MSNYKGGYAIFDCENRKIKNGETIPGLYDFFEGLNGKFPVLQKFIPNDGATPVTTPVLISVASTSFVFVYAISGTTVYIASVNDDDEITVTELAEASTPATTDTLGLVKGIAWDDTFEPASQTVASVYTSYTTLLEALVDSGIIIKEED